MNNSLSKSTVISRNYMALSHNYMLACDNEKIQYLTTRERNAGIIVRNVVLIPVKEFARETCLASISHKDLTLDRQGSQIIKSNQILQNCLKQDVFYIRSFWSPQINPKFPSQYQDSSW